jgi:uncharacterized membrane protein
MSNLFKVVNWAGIAVCAMIPIAEGYFNAKQFTMFWKGTDTRQVEILASAATVGVQATFIVIGVLMIVCCIMIVKNVAASLPHE